MRTLLKNGTVVDGSGHPKYPGSVVLEDGRILSVLRGEAPEDFPGAVIDCAGLTIAPGFIDAHSHNDWYAARTEPLPYFTPFAEQGVTTQVTGNCGFSPFGYRQGTPYRHLLGSGLFDVGDAPDEGFHTFSGWREEAELRSPLNLAPLQGHGSIRIGLSGYENRPLTAEEMKLHDETLEESLSQGAFGLSYGLMYEPDRYATREELYSAARTAAKHNKILTVHARACSAASTSYSPPFGGRAHNLRALDEMLLLAWETGVRLQYSHLIFVGEASWKTAEESLALIDRARADGVDVQYDMYAMTFGVSVITVVLPSWYLSLPENKKRSPATRARLALEIGVTKRALGFGFSDMQIAWLGEGHEDLCGKRVPEIARLWNVSELDAYLRLADLSRGKGRVNMYRYYSEPILFELMQYEHSLFMTDAWIEEKGVQNAAAYSCFPTFLQWARERKSGLTLEQTVRKMTGATADRFRIKERGYLREGYFADVTVFDFDRIAAHGDLPVKPEGVTHVFVNGRHAVKNGAADPASLSGAGSILVSRP
ncbi:MAG TPA: amidohydrolase family protein [Feifaniaceae bacterium]|nr:amidohydrolase family protein [Feifaniaceae bacterium]